ncbi:MAG: 16S rRNA (guanine(527)-N(7))-methyltransferase RsmG, partial [Akkermansiaceae bacterium]|nr:16S rRNA (guanine(527)-N(7))-methyltransferase RsmG [Akkermansiaceae bacterium]
MISADVAAQLAALNVSRESFERLEIYVETLTAWQARINLVGPSTLKEIWPRHILDCAQLLPHIPPETKLVADLGSGAGLPGLILGIARPYRVHLYESSGKKAAFLSAAIEAMGITNARVIPARIESLSIAKPDVITARALASLPKLLSYAYEIGGETALCIFPKGQDVAVELTEAAKILAYGDRAAAQPDEPRLDRSAHQKAPAEAAGPLNP